MDESNVFRKLCPGLGQWTSTSGEDTHAPLNRLFRSMARMTAHQCADRALRTGFRECALARPISPPAAGCKLFVELFAGR